MSNKCWICGRTEEDFERDFLNVVLDDEEISDEMKEIAIKGKCDVDWTNPYGEDHIKICMVDEYMLGNMPMLSKNKDKEAEALFIPLCSVCSCLLNNQANDAINHIEDEYSALLNWFYKETD